MSILLGDKNLRVLVNPGDHNPLHVHVISREFEVKIDISGEQACVSEKGQKHQGSTGAVPSQFAISKNRSPEILCLAKNLSWPRASSMTQLPEKSL
jgi:hypothetical protein